MKKIFLIFTIFVVLICISSFSWAFDNDVTYTVDFSPINYNFVCTFTNTDLSSLSINTSYTYVTIGKFNSDYCIYFCNGDMYSYNHSSYYRFINLNDGGIVRMSFSSSLTSANITDGSKSVAGACFFDMTGSIGSSSNCIYTDEYFNTLFTSNYYVFSSSILTDNSSGENGGENGGESGEEEDNNSLVSSIAQMLINIVVPTNEQWDDLQDDFQDNILDKFHITSMSFNNDLIYDWRCYYIFTKQCSYINFWTMAERLTYRMLMKY